MTGPSTAAVRSRATIEQGIDSLRGGAEAAGWHAGRVGSWTYAHKRVLRIGTLIAAGLVLVWWTRPTGWVVVMTALVVLVVLAVIEFLGRPAGAARGRSRRHRDGREVTGASSRPQAMPLVRRTLHPSRQPLHPPASAPTVLRHLPAHGPTRQRASELGDITPGG